MITADIDKTSRRDNAAWLEDLRAEGPVRDQAILDLRDYLLRAILLYLTRRRGDLSGLDMDELRQLADDWSQQALLKVLDHLEGFRGDSKFTTWAYRVAINVVASDLRRASWRNVSLEALTESESPDRALQADSEEPSPEAKLNRRMVWEAIDSAIAEDLTERQRTVITRVVLQGEAVETVAAELDTNRNNIYKIVHDARRKLKRTLLARDWSSEDVLAAFSNSEAGG